MSETQNPLDAKRLSFAFILAGIIVLGAFSIPSGGSGGGSTYNPNIDTFALSSDTTLDCPGNQFCGGGLGGLTKSTGIGGIILPSNHGELDVFSNLVIKVNVTATTNAFTFILYRNQSLNVPNAGVVCNANQLMQPNLFQIQQLSISPALAAVGYTFTSTWAETQPTFVTIPATPFVYFWCANFEPVNVRFTFVGRGSFQGNTEITINEF